MNTRKTAVAVNGVGPGAGQNARDAATQRELRRIAKASRKLETIRDDCYCHMPATVYIPMHEYEGIAWNLEQKPMAYENKEDCKVALDQAGGDYISTVTVVPSSHQHKYDEVTGELIEDSHE